MILDHNTRDEEESYGNTVKLTMWNLIDEERDPTPEEKEHRNTGMATRRRTGAPGDEVEVLSKSRSKVSRMRLYFMPCWPLVHHGS